MRNGNDRLEDSDKIFVTVVLWIAAIAIFATALTLPMLPDRVTIFYQPVDFEIQSYSKYNNLLLVLVSVIPAGIVLTGTALKKRGKISRNFTSVLLFCVMLSVCMGGVTIYGIMKQFDSSSLIKRVDTHQIIVLSVCFLLSMVAAVMPMLTHTDKFAAKANKRTMYQTYLYITADRFWNIGAYGFLLCSIVSAFVPGYYAYIPLGVTLIKIR